MLEPGCGELLQAPEIAAIATRLNIPVQEHDPRADRTVMDLAPVSSTLPTARNDLGARFADLEAVLAAIAEILPRAQASENNPTRFEGDPVAFTQALHPGGFRPSRKAGKRRRECRAGPIEVRFILFDRSPTV